MTAELNRSVGPWQRFAAAGERWERRLDQTFGKKKEESLSRYALRGLVMITLLVLGMLVATCGIVWSIGGLPDAGTLFMLPRLFPLMIVGSWSMLVATAYVDSLTTTGSRRWALLFLHSTAWGLTLTALSASFWWSISERGLDPRQLALLGAEIWAVIAGLLILIAFAVDYSRLLRRRREIWTLLEIDE